MEQIKPMNFTITEEVEGKDRESSKLESFFIEKSDSIFRFSIFILMITALLIVGFIADAVIFADNLMKINHLLAYGYITLLAGVVYFIVVYSYREISQFLTITQVEKIQEMVESLKENPNRETIRFANSFINKYKDSRVDGVQEGIDSFQAVYPQLSYEEIIPSLSQKILSPIDLEAEKLIFKYAKENAVGTAISPLPLFDAIFIIWRNLRMVNEIAQLYGFRAGFFGNLIILRRLAEQLMFIGVTEIAEDSLGVLTGQTIASKISASVASGVGNAILTVRVGVATIQVVRPIRAKSRISLIGKFLKSFNPFHKRTK